MSQRIVGEIVPFFQVDSLCVQVRLNDQDECNDSRTFAPVHMTGVGVGNDVRSFAVVCRPGSVIQLDISSTGQTGFQLEVRLDGRDRVDVARELFVIPPGNRVAHDERSWATLSRFQVARATLVVGRWSNTDRDSDRTRWVCTVRTTPLRAFAQRGQWIPARPRSRAKTPVLKAQALASATPDAGAGRIDEGAPSEKTYATTDAAGGRIDEGAYSKQTFAVIEQFETVRDEDPSTLTFYVLVAKEPPVGEVAAAESPFVRDAPGEIAERRFDRIGLGSDVILHALVPAGDGYAYYRHVDRSLHRAGHLSSVPLNQVANSDPCVYGGRVFYQGSDNNIYAFPLTAPAAVIPLKGKSGRVLRCHDTPFAFDNKLYCRGENEILYCVSLDDLDSELRFPTLDGSHHRTLYTPCVHDGRVYFCGSDGVMYHGPADASQAAVPLKLGEMTFRARSAPRVLEGWLYFYGVDLRLIRYHLSSTDVVEWLTNDPREQTSLKAYKTDLYADERGPLPCAPGDGHVYFYSLADGHFYKLKSVRGASPTRMNDFSDAARVHISQKHSWGDIWQPKPPMSTGDGYMYVVGGDRVMWMVPVELV